MREPTWAERRFFAKHANVSGMATEDLAVILNPYSSLTDHELGAVAINEAARVFIKRRRINPPCFSLTPEQRRAFKHYGAAEDVRATIAARILTGDPSALSPTRQQLFFVERLRSAMHLSR